MADRCRLLIAGDGGDRDRRTKHIRRRGAEIVTGVAHLGQQRARNPEPVEQFHIPGKAPDIEQHCAGGVGHVGGMTLPAGQAPQQKAVDRTTGDLAHAGAPVEPGNVVKQPADLRGGKIGVDNQPSVPRDDFREARRTPAFA